MDQYIGKMLDNRYEILECIGIGGMAMVYKAKCHRLNRLVAIKILKPELARDAEFRRRFQDESKAVAMLSHANIVGVYDTCQTDGLNYIVMELIDGMTLKQYMQKRGTPLPWQETLHFISQIVQALGHAHSRGIIHRDVKPHNILVLRDGTIKVADFGIARLTGAEHVTMTQEALGSVHYISPEQAKGSHIDGRSDLYSVGVMMYEMLTGRLPFEGESPVMIAIQHINSIPIQPRELNPEIPPALEAIILKAMAPNPDMRYASAEKMLEALSEFQKNPDTEPTQIAPAISTDEPTVVMSTAALRKMEESHISSTRYPNQIDEFDEDESEEETSRRHRRSMRSPIDFFRNLQIPPIAIAIFAVLLFVGGIIIFLYNFLAQGMNEKPQEYPVPNVLGYTLEELEEDPSILGNFTITVDQTIPSEEYEKGEICSQTPTSDTTVTEDKRVITVNISSGDEEMKMINVTGWAAQRALAVLQDDMGLVVKQEYEYSPTVAEGYVISFTPIVDSDLKKGDQVTIVISQGPEEVTIEVSNYVNLPLEQALAQLTLQGLSRGEVTEYYSDTYPAGRVIWQSIPNKSKVSPGTAIDFQVSKGPEPQPSPSVSPSPEVSNPLPSPSTPVQSTKTIVVDLSEYTGTVAVRITVGNDVPFDGTVDSSVGELRKDVTSSGSQVVNIYINGNLDESYTLVF